MSNYIIKIISVNSDKNKNWQALQEQYIKYLQKWAKVEIVELKSKNYNNQNREGILQAESSIWQKIVDKKKVGLEKYIVLDIEGKSFDTVGFSEFLEKNDKNHLVFLIGGPYGLPQNIRENSDFKISLSALTFNHQLAKLMLLEQLYRCLDIQAQGKYHK